MSKTPFEIVTAFLNCESLKDAVDLVAEDVSVEDWFAPKRNYTGRMELFEEILIPAAEAFSESNYTYNAIIGQDGIIALRGKFSARFVEHYHGYEPTRSIVEWDFHDFFETRDGIIVSMFFGSDTLAIHRALTAR